MSKITTSSVFNGLARFVRPTCPTLPNLKGDRLGTKFFNVFTPLHPLCLTYLTYIYIFIGSAQQHAAADAATKDGLVGWAGWANPFKGRKSLPKSVPNLQIRLGALPNLWGER